MKGIAFTCSLLFSAGAMSAPASSDEFKTNLLTACFSVVAYNSMVQHASPEKRVEIITALKADSSNVAIQLSEPLPQTYSAILTGLNSIIEYSDLPPRSDQLIADHSAVLGLWCVQDTVSSITKATGGALEQDLQVELIDLYSELVIETQND